MGAIVEILFEQSGIKGEKDLDHLCKQNMLKVSKVKRLIMQKRSFSAVIWLIIRCSIQHHYLML